MCQVARDGHKTASGCLGLVCGNFNEPGAAVHIRPIEAENLFGAQTGKGGESKAWT